MLSGHTLAVKRVSLTCTAAVVRLVVLVEGAVVLCCDLVRGGIHEDLSTDVERKLLTATLHWNGSMQSGICFNGGVLLHV